MNLIDQILQQARNFLVCPVCNRHYAGNEIRLRGFIDNTYIFQAFCAKGHKPLAVTYLASLHKLEKPISAYFHNLTGTKITPELLKKAEVALESFDGDFSKLWSD